MGRLFGKLMSTVSERAVNVWRAAFPKAASTAEHAAEGAARNAGRASNTAERAQIRIQDGQRIAQNPTGKQFIANDNLRALSSGKSSDLASFNSRLDKAFDEFRENGMIVANGRNARAMTPDQAQAALRAGRPINQASADALEDSLRHKFLKAHSPEYAARHAENIATREAAASQAAASNPGFLKSVTLSALKPLLPIVGALGITAGLDQGLNDGRVTDWLTRQASIRDTRSQGDLASTEVTSGMQQDLQTSTGPISVDVNALANSQAPASPQSNEINLSEVFSNLSKYGNLTAEEANTLQDAYNNAAGRDGNLDIRNNQEKTAFVEGLQSLPEEKRNAVTEAFGINMR